MRLFKIINNLIASKCNLPEYYSIILNYDEEGEYMPAYKGEILGSRYNYIGGAIQECWEVLDNENME